MICSGPSSVAVTGSSGTMGTALCLRLIEKGLNVTGVDITPNQWSDKVNNITLKTDLRKRNSQNELPTDVDLIVHLAANARVHDLVQNPRKARDNFEMTYNILEHARSEGINVIFASSREVYAKSDRILHSESETSIDTCESPYTASKIGGEALAKSYQNCYDMEVSILRFSNVYGRFDGSNRVVPLFISQANSGKNLTVFGDSKILDFTYLDDCIDGIIRTIMKYHKAKGTTFNIASGEGASIVELAETIVGRTNSSSSINVEGSRTGEISRYVADISKAKQVLGYEPQYSIEEGLEATIDWYTERENILNEIS